MAEESLIVRLLKNGRILRGLSIAQAAQSAGVNASYCSHIEHAGPKIPSADWLRKVSHTAGSPWLSTSINERMFLGAAWATWANPSHFVKETTPPLPVIVAIADALSDALAPIISEPLPLEMISDAETHAFATTCGRSLAESYQLPVLSQLPSGHRVSPALMSVLLVWGLTAGGAQAVTEAETWLAIMGGGASYVAGMLASALPVWIQSSTTATPPHDNWPYVQQRWGQLSPLQQDLVTRLIASWFPD